MNHAAHRMASVALISALSCLMIMFLVGCPTDDEPTGGGATGLFVVAQLAKMANVPFAQAIAMLQRLLDPEEGATVRMIAAGDTLVLDDQGGGLYVAPLGATFGVAFAGSYQLSITTSENEQVTGSITIPDSFDITYPPVLGAHRTTDTLEIEWEPIDGADLIIVSLDASFEPQPEGLPWVTSPPLGGDATSVTVPDSVIPAQGGLMVASVIGIAGGYIDPITYDYYQSEENLTGAIGFFGSAAQNAVFFTLVP
ncbi:hypothetical protein AMJ71_04070 [candidate division TA06 bacterium SM1_40]|jgi:hypothetical protein|uniref:Uncharacterized protein n=1 Tax=candidate division TA06 bacterium SM1_40 TaxID=1703773 RepID=A0A0S8JKC8_UNCT6|nr:MAG: hypothetical protein AMJ71_04070 [candidate division TA06 bacterium SM1_40]